MKKAIIDIGSNTINLLIAEYEKGVFTVLEDRKIHAKLAKGGINKGAIAPDAFLRGIDALDKHKALCVQYQLSDDAIVTYATASVRAASNGHIFVEEARKRFNLNVLTIDGDMEALLIHSGIKHGFPLSAEPVLIMDIGGGSVEFIVSTDTGIHWKRSFNIGVTRLLDRFAPNDPPSQSDLELVKQFALSELKDLFAVVKKHRPVAIVGSSGSFDTIRAMMEKTHKNKHESDKTWFVIDKDALLEMASDLTRMTTAQRKMVEGMDAMRAEYFPMAFVLILLMVDALPLARIYQCSYALKEGAFFFNV
jgi:exopolyphosphatase/guanosine-5'-triphosphate,3'-diphosphate pyrophosphatase